MEKCLNISCAFYTDTRQKPDRRRTIMPNVEIADEVYKEWIELFERQDKLEYPTLKNFTAKKLREVIERERKRLEKAREE